jgi:hypothetical protein
LHKLWEASLSQLCCEQSRRREEMLELCGKEGLDGRTWLGGSGLGGENMEHMKADACILAWKLALKDGYWVGWLECTNTIIDL